VQVLIILFGSFAIYEGLAALGVALFSPWTAAARAALVTMLGFTSAAHFTATRRDLIAMVPAALPRPDVLVAATGVAEAVLAVLLLVPRIRSVAALALIALFVVMFPANVSAARRGVQLRGRMATPLWLRTPMQVLFILWAWLVR
jgi:uncharacterized membrane protein